MVTNTDGKVDISDVTVTELGYLDGEATTSTYCRVTDDAKE